MFKTVQHANADFYFNSLGQLLLSAGYTQNRTEERKSNPYTGMLSQSIIQVSTVRSEFKH